MSLFVVALTNTTEFTEKEGMVYDSIITERNIRRKLKKDAGIIIKDFLLIVYLKKKTQD